MYKTRHTKKLLPEQLSIVYMKTDYEFLADWQVAATHRFLPE